VVQISKECSYKDKNVEKVNIDGQMDLIMMEIGYKICSMDMVRKYGLMVDNILDNGNKIKCMEKEF